MFPFRHSSILQLPGLIISFWALLGTNPLAGQTPSWEVHTSAGNRALLDSMLSEAAVNFRLALSAAIRFPPEDMRRTTALRNLAHTLTLSGSYMEADSLYRQAISRSERLVPDDHAYRQALKLEHDALLDAIRRSGELDPEIVEPLTWMDIFIDWRDRLGSRTTFQTGPVFALGDLVAASHNPALLHILALRWPVWVSGGTTITANLQRIAGRLPADKRRFSPPLTFRGLDIGAGLQLGWLNLEAGLGPFSIRTTESREVRLVLSTALTVTVWDGTGRRSEPGFYLMIAANMLRLPVAPGSDTGTLLAGGGLSVGYHWK